VLEAIQHVLVLCRYQTVSIPLELATNPHDFVEDRPRRASIGDKSVAPSRFPSNVPRDRSDGLFEGQEISHALQEDLIMRSSIKKVLASRVASTKSTPVPKKTTHTKPNGALKGAAPAKTSAAQSTAGNPVPAPPDWTFPSVPNGFEAPSAAIVHRRSKPTDAMRAEARDFAAELRSGTTYATDFGKRAPDRIAMADGVEIATQWDAVYEAVAPVAEYALAMRGAAWDSALKPVNKLRTAYEIAVSDEPSIASTWRQTAAFFGAREEPARRAAATKAKAKKAAMRKAKAAAKALSPKG
jgi:hypothetical protein